MPAMPSSDDVAVWLRFQIAAGRLPDAADFAQMDELARKLGVTVGTISAAYDRIRGAGAGCPAHGGVRARRGGFSTIAHLVDEIVELDGFESETPPDL